VAVLRRKVRQHRSIGEVRKGEKPKERNGRGGEKRKGGGRTALQKHVMMPSAERQLQRAPVSKKNTKSHSSRPVPKKKTGKARRAASAAAHSTPDTPPAGAKRHPHAPARTRKHVSTRSKNIENPKARPIAEPPRAAARTPTRNNLREGLSAARTRSRERDQKKKKKKVGRINQSLKTRQIVKRRGGVTPHTLRRPSPSLQAPVLSVVENE
jgi:hypothetical protein